jgi:hypothetical protein
VAPTGAFTVLHDFDVHPVTPLVQAADGNLYGLTERR